MERSPASTVGSSPEAPPSRGGAPAAGLPDRLRAARQGTGDLLRLTKPRITALVCVTAAAGHLVAASGPDSADARLLHLLVGTTLLAGGTNALNQLLEREADGRMARTRRRPLPAGRLPPGAAGALGMGGVAAGGLWLLQNVNGLTAALGLASAVLYVAVYTPMKRRSWSSLLVGAVPGALPALGGWTAARGSVDPAGLALFGILFLWQLPHFLSLGWLLREDYRRAGFAVLAVDDPGGVRSRTGAVLSALVLLPVALLPTLLGLAGWAYGAAAAILGLGYLAAAGRFGVPGGSEEEDARRLFRASLLFLPALLAALVVDVRLVESAAPSPESLPAFHAGLNATAALLLATGGALVSARRIRGHRRAMLGAAAASAVFLASYLVYHATVGSVPYSGTGWARAIYLAVLGSHAGLAVLVLPLALVTLVRGLADRRARHRRIARWTWPLWMYVSITGLVVYGMLYG